MADDLPEWIRASRRLLRRRHVAIGAGALLIVALGLIGFSVYYYAYVTRNTERLADRLIMEARTQFQGVDLLASAERTALRTYRNEEHVEKAQELGVSPLENREEAERLIRSNALVPLRDNAYYRVQEMDYSLPYVTESTENLLTLIGVRFQEALREQGLPPYRYVITSGTRTRADQQALQDVNVNAAETSSHEYGTTVDLHYREFDYAAELDTLPAAEDISPVYLQELLARGYSALGSRHEKALKAILGRVLRELQQEEKVLVIYERLQPVYHITVADQIPAPADYAARPRNATDQDQAPPLLKLP